MTVDPSPLKTLDGNHKFVRTAEQVAKDHEAADMRRRSLKLREIGEHFGVTPQAAALMIQRAIADIPKGSTEELVATELEKLDAIERKALEIMERIHPVVSASGKIVTKVVEVDGELRSVELIDAGPTLGALDRLLKVAAQRARLLGLNAPTNVRLEVVSYDADTIDLEFEEFRQRALSAGSGDSTGLLDPSEGET